MIFLLGLGFRTIGPAKSWRLNNQIDATLNTWYTSNQRLEQEIFYYEVLEKIGSSNIVPKFISFGVLVVELYRRK